MEIARFSELAAYGYIVVPVEHYAEIRKQLLSWDMKEEENFYILKSDSYQDFSREFFRKYTGKYLVFGESLLSCVLLDESSKGSMVDDLYAVYDKNDMKILSIGCMGMEESFYYLQKQIALGMRPENLWLFVNFETLSEHHHILPRVQHPELVEMIQNRSKGVEPDMSKYVETARRRAQDYRLELQYSPRRTYNEEPNEEEVQKEYTRQQLLSPVSLEYEECKYLAKILGIAKKNRIDVSVIIVPVNYQKATKFFDDDFKEMHKRNIEMLDRLCMEYKCRFWNVSELLEEQFFETKVTLQDGIKEEGRKKIVNQIQKYEKGKH